jgi:hypothetical protein
MHQTSAAQRPSRRELLKDPQSLVRPVAEETQEGQSSPIGATVSADGTNFSVTQNTQQGSNSYFSILLMTLDPSV